MSKRSYAAALATILCIASIANAAETVTYTYDVFGRLNAAQTSGGPANGVVRSYSYDAADNRTRSGTVTITPIRPVSNATSAGAEIGVKLPGISTGMVTFTENGVFLGSAYVSAGEASVFLQGFPLGTHTITASYSEDGGVTTLFSFTFTIRVQNLSWLPGVLQLLLE